MKAAYVQCSPISVSYSNIIHLREAFRLSGAKRFFLCIWDPVVFEDPAFFARSDGKRTRMERLEENARMHQRILELEGAEVTTIHLSDAWSRLFSKPELGRLFNAILSKVRVSDLTKRGGLPREDITLSRINYVIADFLVAAMFHRLYPELSAAPPAQYVTSRRLAPLLPAIHTVMEDPLSKHPIPEIVWIAPFPVIMDSHGLIPSIEMSVFKLEQTIDDGLKRSDIGLHEMGKLYSLLGIKHTPFGRKGLEAPAYAHVLAKDFSHWFGSIRQALAQPAPQGPKAIRITNPDQFHKSVRQLSAIKLRILSLCDGTKTSYTIAKALGIKQVTASVYLGRLRALGFVSEGRRPVRTVSSVLVDLDVMK